MDPLGKKGEEAFEGVQNVSQRLEQLESHLKAVDSALQDFMDDSQEFLQREYNIEQRELEKLEEVAEKVSGDEEVMESVDERLDKLERRQRKMEKKVDKILDNELMSAIGRVTDTIKKINRASRDLRNDLNQLESRIDEVENDLMVEANKRDYDFDQKLDKSEFEAEKVELMDEIRKLRASVNVLADELDQKNAIEVD